MIILLFFCLFIIYFIERSLNEYNDKNIKYLNEFWRTLGVEIKYLQEICEKLNENRNCNKAQQVQASSLSDDVMGCDREQGL